MAAPSTANLKNTKHVNVVLQAPRWDRALVSGFLDWLALRSLEPISREAKSAHLDELERRIEGKSLVSVSEQSGVPLREFGFMPNVLKHFSYALVKRPRLDLSLDVFNAGDELGIGDEPPGLVLELFAVDGRAIMPLVEIAMEAVRDWPVEYVFGGKEVFTADFAAARIKARAGGEALRVRDFLWPLTFNRDLAGIDDRTLRELPVFRVEREAHGVWIWLFEDLSMGHNDHYSAAAKALGLRSLWERAILYG